MEGLPEVASHRIEILSGLLFLGHLIVLTYGHPILKAPESVTGTWKKDVTIPCIYEPLGGYRQVLVKWLVQRGSDPVTIFLHDSTGDHIQQAKYRGRLKMSQKVLGDVSLQLNTLQMDDKNRYTCEVTWQTPDGNQVTRDEIIELRVQKYPYYPPIINTEALTTMQSSLEATTIMNSTSYSTINVTGKHEETISSPGRNLTIFAIIFIISFCCIVVVTIAYIMFRRRKFQQEYVYEVNRVCTRKTSSSEETTRVTDVASEYFRDESDSHALINDYSDDLCLSQEYQITTRSTMTIPAC
ncbi:V-set and immunoglobulin domain-containing protein 4 isoform X2 [Grammomys surdaster]|uniref:V-set and immunoglobulin domain-containing protein 4 isoform X2 n=1 Tax=Grammomys surdaster TaxID=491861 RepID=UPI00109FFF17|nr:V-set and immunoglobulin domain-containing protein 4 isoform X2 [Grammomys surdaster]